MKSQKLTSRKRQLGDQFGWNAAFLSCQRATARQQRYRLQRCRRPRCARPHPGCRPEKRGRSACSGRHAGWPILTRQRTNMSALQPRGWRENPIGAVSAIRKAVLTLFSVRNLAGVLPDALCDGEIASNFIMQLGNEVKEAGFILVVNPPVG